MDPFPRTFTTKDGLALTVDLSRPEELDDICKFLRKHYFSSSPMCYLFKNCPAEANMKNFIVGFLSDPVSLTVRDPTGRIVAIRLNELEVRFGTSLDANLLFDKGEKGLVVALVEAVNQDFDIFEKFNTDKIFCMGMLGVDPSYGRLGLGSALVAMSLELAKFHNTGAIRVYAFNENIVRIASKYGLETVKSIDYATFEFNGDRPLAHQKDLLNEHTSVHCMARKI